MVTRRRVVIVLGALAYAPCRLLAQQSAKVSRIGLLSALGESSVSARVTAFRSGLKDLGYVEGKNVVIEYRYADGDPERLRSMAAELARLKVDVIVATGPTTTPAAKAATSTIPIVMGFDSDPVGAGLINSLARPGGNITGLSGLSPELSGKQLELLKEIVPKLARVAVVGSSTAAGGAQSLSAIELAADALKVKLQYLNVRDLEDIKSAFREAGKARAGAMIVLANSAATNHRKAVAELALKSRLPAMYYTSEFVEDGGLMTYGVSSTDLFRRAATYVDKILKGAKPGDLPVEQPTLFELVINMKTATALGIKFPNSILVRATKIIE